MAPLPEDDWPDFSTPPKKVRFRIEPDWFEGYEELSAEGLLLYVDAFNRSLDAGKLDSDATLQLFASTLELVLKPESLALFMHRLRKDRPESMRPISIDQTYQAMTYLIERYSLRPTRPSNPSPDGSADPTSGTDSTVTASHGGSTPADSPPPTS